MTLWLATQPLVLASKSEARRRVLENAGIAVETRPADIDERALEAKAGISDPGAVAALLARAKAQAVAAAMPGRIVLGADQTLALGARRFSKPDGREGAREQLRALSGQTHTLHTACALVVNGKAAFEHSETARLTMRALTEPFIESYLDAAGDKVTASVGAYQIEGLGIHLFDRFEGDYFGVLGLPLTALLGYFHRNGFTVS